MKKLLDHVKLPEKFKNRGEGSSGRDFSKDSSKRNEMNAALPEKTAQARRGFQLVESFQRHNLTDQNVSNALEVADPIKSYYQTYQKYLNMDKDTYKSLTEEYTKKRNAWNNRWSNLTGYETSNVIEQDFARLRLQVIAITYNFLQKASFDLRDRLNPGSEVRAQIRNEVKEVWKHAMEQRWREVLRRGT